ncbi:MAG: hypothetical protein GXP09_02765 [Gammaproteobacteria bacterium]|nr:hypothetical protein [Gammaproteobacteria bacterium]
MKRTKNPGTKSSFLVRLLSGKTKLGSPKNPLTKTNSGLSEYSTIVGVDGSVAPSKKPRRRTRRDHYLEAKWHVSLTQNMVRHISGLEAQLELNTDGSLVAHPVHGESFSKLPTETQCRFLAEGAEAYERVLDVRNPEWRKTVSNIRTQRDDS